MNTEARRRYGWRRKAAGARQLRTHRRLTWRSLLRRPVPHLVALFVFLMGLYLLATSSLFSITTIQVIGDPRVPSALIRASCDCINKNIFLSHPEQIQQHLQRTPWIQLRRAYERLPNRIIVDAKFRSAAVLWRTTVATYSVDTDGTVLYDVKNPPVPTDIVPTTKTVPLVYSPRDTTFKPGQQILFGSAAVHMVESVQANLTLAVKKTVDRYRWSPVSGLAGHTTQKWWFFIGKDVSNRIAALNAAIAEGVPGRNHCNYIDFQAMPYPYCYFSKQWASLTGPP